MSRVGCRTLLRYVCQHKKLAIILVSNKLYYHPITIKYTKIGIMNQIMIGNKMIITHVNKMNVRVTVKENSCVILLHMSKLGSMRLSMRKNNQRFNIWLCNGKALGDMQVSSFVKFMSKDIFGNCMVIFEAFKKFYV
jgi:hypothetical protein